MHIAFAINKSVSTGSLVWTIICNRGEQTPIKIHDYGPQTCLGILLPSISGMQQNSRDAGIDIFHGLVCEWLVSLANLIEDFNASFECSLHVDPPRCCADTQVLPIKKVLGKTRISKDILLAAHLLDCVAVLVTVCTLHGSTKKGTVLCNLVHLS